MTIEAIPWLAPDVIDFLDSNLEPHFKVFEYGSGGSTLWLAERVSSVIAVEHNGQWVAKLQQQGIPTNVELLHKRILIDREKKTTCPHDYINIIEQYPDGHFDFISVDGRFRRRCIQKAIPKVKPGGWLMLHDAERAHYHCALSQLSGFQANIFYENMYHNDHFSYVRITKLWQLNINVQRRHFKRSKGKTFQPGQLNSHDISSIGELHTEAIPSESSADFERINGPTNSNLSIKELMYRADNYYNSRQYEEALQCLNRVVDHKSDHIDAWRRVAAIAKDLNDYKTFEIVSRRIVELTPVRTHNRLTDSPVMVRPEITWEDVLKMPEINLYAGDITRDNGYKNVIGLSITQSDHRHIRHDITRPLPLPNDSIDSYQAEDVFEHIEYEKLVSVINEIYRVLKPGATFRLSVPDYGCDVLINRSVKDKQGRILFDPGGGGTPENPGHLWFPRIDTVKRLLEHTLFQQRGWIEYLHYYSMDGLFVMKPIDYSKGHVQRTPDFDTRVQNPRRPMSMVIDLIKL